MGASARAGRAARSTFFFFQAEAGIRVLTVTGVQTCALPIWARHCRRARGAWASNFSSLPSTTVRPRSWRIFLRGSASTRPESISRRRSPAGRRADRKSTRLNSSHSQISYAVFCLKKKNMVLRLLKRGHRMVAFDQSPDAVKSHVSQGAVGANSLEDFVKAFESRPRVMWVMLPAGEPTTQSINKLVELGDSGDIIIDGGNTNWKIALQDAARVKAKGMHYMDAGTSGGIWGLEYGYCLMVGAEQDIYDNRLPLLKDLAPDDGGLVRTGPEGSGHFVKMVHNGVEYGLMQAYAEGFQVMKLSRSFPGMNMQAIAEAWRTGSAGRSRLPDLIARRLTQGPEPSS